MTLLNCYYVSFHNSYGERYYVSFDNGYDEVYSSYEMERLPPMIDSVVKSIPISWNRNSYFGFGGGKGWRSLPEIEHKAHPHDVFSSKVHAVNVNEIGCKICKGFSNRLCGVKVVYGSDRSNSFPHEDNIISSSSRPDEDGLYVESVAYFEVCLECQKNLENHILATKEDTSAWKWLYKEGLEYQKRVEKLIRETSVKTLTKVGDVENMQDFTQRLNGLGLFFYRVFKGLMNWRKK